MGERAMTENKSKPTTSAKAADDNSSKDIPSENSTIKENQNRVSVLVKKKTLKYKETLHKLQIEQIGRASCRERV